MNDENDEASGQIKLKNAQCDFVMEQSTRKKIKLMARQMEFNELIEGKVTQNPIIGDLEAMSQQGSIILKTFEQIEALSFNASKNAKQENQFVMDIVLHQTQPYKDIMLDFYNVTARAETLKLFQFIDFICLVDECFPVSDNNVQGMSVIVNLQNGSLLFPTLHNSSKNQLIAKGNLNYIYQKKMINGLPQRNHQVNWRELEIFIC